jgi:hypothetical protein
MNREMLMDHLAERHIAEDKDVELATNAPT